LSRLCRGSVYAYRESIKNGYIDFSGGVRVGLCGRALTEGGTLSSVVDISGFCFRIPHTVKGIGEEAYRALLSLPKGVGLLIYSPPNGGKTTLLRELSLRLSGGSSPRRVVLLDSRGELYSPTFFPPDALLDVLLEYPGEKAILQAIKSLSPEFLVCDEIGGAEESEALRLAVGCGVPLLCSAHGGDLSSLLARPPVALLRKARAFGAYIGIERAGDRFTYTVTTESEIAPFIKKEGLC
jgi:stage III sporulation protein AA